MSVYTSASVNSFPRHGLITVDTIQHISKTGESMIPRVPVDGHDGLREVTWFRTIRDLQSKLSYFLDKNCVLLEHISGEYRRFCLLDSPTEAKRFIESWPLDARNFHEKWRGDRPHKLHIDFDMKVAGSFADIKAELVKAITRSFKYCFHQILFEANITVYNTHRDNKISFHFIVEGYTSPYALASREFARKVQEYSTTYGAYVDIGSRYTDDYASLRCPLVPKDGTVKACETGNPFSLVGDTADCTLLEPRTSIVTTKNSRQAVPVNTALSASVKQLASEATVDADSKVHWNGSVCPICSRIHEHDRGFVFKNKRTKQVMIGCFRNPGKVMPLVAAKPVSEGIEIDLEVEDQDVGAADKIIEALADDIRKDSNGNVWIREGNMWVQLTGNNERLLAKRIMRMDICLAKEDNVCVLSKKTKIAGLWADTVVTLLDASKEFLTQLQTSSNGYVCFEDGVFNCSTLAFEHWETHPEIITNQIIDRPAPRAIDGGALTWDHEIVKRCILDIENMFVPTNGDRDLLTYMLAKMAQWISGVYPDSKEWMLAVGLRNSGKSMMADMMMTAFKPYIGSVVSSVFNDKPVVGGDQAKLNSWMIPLENKRIVFGPELSGKVNGVVIKMFEGGDTTTVRNNNTNERELKLKCKLVVSGNDDVTIEPADTLETSIRVAYPNKFVNEVDSGNLSHRKADKEIKTRYTSDPEYIDAFTWIILNSFKGFVPNPVTEYSQFDPEDALIKDLFDFTGKVEDALTKERVHNLLASLKISSKKVKTLLTNRGAVGNGNAKDQCNVRGELYKKVCYFGLILRTREAGDVLPETDEFI